MSNSLFNRFRSLFGLPAAGGEPKNDFRNPIWGSDDEDDDDDELYHNPDVKEGGLNITIYTDPMDFNGIMTKQMCELFKTFNGMMGDVTSMFEEESLAIPAVPELAPESQQGSIRDHYLKPGYKEHHRGRKEDVDLDGKISSHEIAGLLKEKEFLDPSIGHFGGKRSNTSGTFFQTIITQSVTKSDGTIETRRIVKDHLGNVEETVTRQERDGNNYPIAEPIQQRSFFMDFSSLWKLF